MSIGTALPLLQGFLLVTELLSLELVFFNFFVMGRGCTCMGVLSVKYLSYHYFINTRSTTEALIDVFPMGIMQNHDVKYRLV